MISQSSFGLLFLSLTSLVQSDDIFRQDFCKRNGRFENPKTGFALVNHVLSTVNVKRPSDCVIHCLEHPSCQSINFKITGNPEHVCELNDKTEDEVALTSNSDFKYYGPSELPELNCKADGPGKCKYGEKCVQSCLDDELMCVCEDEAICGPDTDLEFPRTSVEDYVLLHNAMEMESFSLVFWMNTVATTQLTPLSYAVDGSNQEVLVTLTTQHLKLTIQTSSSETFIIPPVNDGFWHHIGILWSNGNYNISLDGTFIYTGSNLGTATPLKGGGVFVIGQTMGTPGANFDSSTSFVGKLCQLNVWNKLLEQQEVRAMSNDCSRNFGTVVDWKDVTRMLNGQLMVIPSQCQSLRNDENYDLAMVASSNTTSVPTYVITSDNIPSLTAVTIVLWAKHSTIFPYIKYVHSPGSGMAFRIEDHALRFSIMGTSKSARIPRYWNENPAYWHHLGMSWSSDSGKWLVFLDGSLVSLMVGVASGKTLPGGGTLVIGNKQSTAGTGMAIEASVDGSVSRVNIWDYVLDGEAIWAMAKGPLSENGNWFAWYGVKNKSVGDMTFEPSPTSLYNSRKDAEYQMEFATRSTDNYARLDNPFQKDLTSISSCFWLKVLSIPVTIFAYSTIQSDEEFEAFLTSENILHIVVHDITTSGISLTAQTYWHFYCFQWRSSDGLAEHYRDGINELNEYILPGVALRAGGAMIVGQDPDGFATGFSQAQAMHGYLTQLNFWHEFLHVDEIQGMASGAINVNGNLLQWRSLRNYILGNVGIVYHRAEPRIPEQPLQKKRDAWCKEKFGGYARFARDQKQKLRWRCINPIAMLPENMCYDIPGNSRYYNTKVELSQLY